MSSRFDMKMETTCTAKAHGRFARCVWEQVSVHGGAGGGSQAMTQPQGLARKEYACMRQAVEAAFLSR
jgi:hypothetical protein